MFQFLEVERRPRVSKDGHVGPDEHPEVLERPDEVARKVVGAGPGLRQAVLHARLGQLVGRGNRRLLLRGKENCSVAQNSYFSLRVLVPVIIFVATKAS